MKALLYRLLYIALISLRDYVSDYTTINIYIYINMLIYIYIYINSMVLCLYSQIIKFRPCKVRMASVLAQVAGSSSSQAPLQECQRQT